LGRRFLRYIERRFRLRARAAALRDSRVHRRKAIHPLLPGLSLRVASVDGHELFATEHRCCDACRVRQVWKGKKETKRLVTECYHAVVVL